MPDAMRAGLALWQYCRRAHTGISWLWQPQDLCIEHAQSDGHLLGKSFEDDGASKAVSSSEKHHRQARLNIRPK